MNEPRFNFDWFSDRIPHWETWFSELKGKPDLLFLEIGCHEGRASLWMLDNVLTAGNSNLVCVDPHQTDSDDYAQFLEGVQERFIHNIEPHKYRVQYLNETSADATKHLQTKYGRFDFVYVDGAHGSHACMHDCVLAYNCLKAGGFAIVDDYRPGHPPWSQTVVLGFDSFAIAYKDLIEVSDPVPSGQIKFVKRGVPWSHRASGV